MSFVLTPHKLIGMMSYFAGLKRNNMHPIMLKRYKVEQLERDLHVLNESQSFLESVPLKETTLTSYNCMIFSLGKYLMDRKKELLKEECCVGSIHTELCKMIIFKDLKLASSTLDVYQQMGNDLEDFKSMVVEKALMIQEEVERKPLNSKEMTHLEFMQHSIDLKKAAAAAKALKGRSIISSSNAAMKFVSLFIFKIIL
jgi:hypothetical protein